MRQLSKGLFASSIIILLTMQEGLAVEWATDEKLDSQFLEDINSGAEHDKYAEKGSYGVTSKSSRKRYDILVDGRLSPMYKTLSSRPSCSCEMNYQAVDLGRAYVPRYIQTGACRKDSCQKRYSCVDKTYKIKVFKRKDAKSSEEAVPFIPVRDNFQDFWSIEVIPVAVACDCVPEFQMVY